MRYDDLFQLNEAPLGPGEIRAIQTKIEHYVDELEKLEKMRGDLRHKVGRFDHPPEIEDKLTAYIEAYKKSIAGLEDQLKQTPATNKFDKLIEGIKKNCSEILQTYRSSGHYFSIPGDGDNSVFYGTAPKRPTMPPEYKQRFENAADVLEEFEIANFDDTIIANVGSNDAMFYNKHRFMFFPRNGFSYFYSSRRRHFLINDIDLPQLMDQDELFTGWYKLINDPSMLDKFQQHGGRISDTSKLDIGQWSGFMGENNFQNHLNTIDSMVEAGDLSADWQPYSRWEAWTSKEVIENFFGMRTNNIASALSLRTAVAFKTSGYYAISARYEKQVFKALEMGWW